MELFRNSHDNIDVTLIAKRSSLESVVNRRGGSGYHAPIIRTEQEKKIAEHMEALFGERGVLSQRMAS